MSSEGSAFTEDGFDHRKCPRVHWRPFLKVLKDNLFMILTLVGVAIGFGLGFGLRAATDSPIVKQWIGLIGKIYINVLDLTILPLIASNLIIVVSKINPKEQGVTSVITLAFIIGMNILGSTIGTATSVIINPGRVVTEENKKNTTTVDPKLQPTTSDVFADLILNIFPDNIVAMCIQQTKTSYAYKASTNNSEVERIVGTTGSKNLIGILLVSIAFGLSARATGKKGMHFLNFFESLSVVTLKMVRAFLLLTPVGVCFMIADAIMGVGDLVATFSSVGLFVVTVTVGIGILFILILLIHFLSTFSNPFPFLPRTLKAWFISFATTSPIVSLPEMFEGCDEYGIDKSISRFVCPIATTLKSDGPAVFISCSCIFVAQRELGTVPPSVIMVIWLLTSVSVLAIPHVPSASILIAITILNSVDVPTQSAFYLYAVDWLLDRFRAGITTITSMYGATLLQSHYSKSGLKAESDNYDFDEVLVKEHDDSTASS